jgi:DNA polymerase III delta prime subunit
MNLIQELEKLNVEPEDLDEIVIECALDLSANANNGGIDEQVEFLRVLGGYGDEKILAMVKEALNFDEAQWDEGFDPDAGSDLEEDE